MKWALTVYWRGMRTGLSTAVAYRGDFVVSLLLSLLQNLGMPLVTLLIYGAGGTFPGWSVYEALLLQSVFTLSNGISQMLFISMVWMTMQSVREGTFDLTLLRPGPAAFHTLAGAFNLDGVGVVLGGAGIMAVCLSHLPALGAAKWALFALFFLMGMAVMLGCVLLMSATAFKWVGNSRIYEIFDSVTAFGRYPGAIFPRGLLAVVSYVLPVMMLGTYPAQALLGGAHGVTPGMWLACVPCVLFLWLGGSLYGRMVKSYKSAGG